MYLSTKSATVRPLNDHSIVVQQAAGDAETLLELAAPLEGTPLNLNSSHHHQDGKTLASAAVGKSGRGACQKRHTRQC